MRIILFLLLISLIGCDHKETLAPQNLSILNEFYIPDSIDAISSIEVQNQKYAEQLGELLFHKRTSTSRVSCNDCHNAQNSFFSDQRLPQGGGEFRKIYVSTFKSFFGEDHPMPVDQQTLKSPGLLNSAFVTNMLWGGELGTGGLNESLPDSIVKGFASFNSHSGLESQVNAASGAHFMDDLVLECKHDYLLQKLSQEAFGMNLSLETVKSSVSIFEQSLLTNQNNVNLYIRGLSDKLEVDGLMVYKSACATCHLGTQVRPKIGESNFEGRFRMTKDSSDYGLVKVPRLENVKDAPGYFHNDEDISLYRAIKRHDLGLTRSEIYAVKRFIEKDLHDPRYSK